MRTNKDIEAVEAADREVAHAAREVREDLPVRALSAVAEFADQPPMILVSTLTLSAGLARGNGRLARAGGRMLAAHLLATGIKSVVKRAVDRTRPAVAEEQGYARGRGRDNTGPLNSFPSGHTAGAVAVGRALTREYQQAALPAGAFVATVAVMQTPAGKHYPSDVAAGALIGLAAEAVVNALMPAWPSKRRPDRSAPS